MSEIREINIINLKMINSFIYISLILYISYLYNLYIYPLIIQIITLNIYNNLLIFIVIITQIDSFIIYNDYIKNKNNDNNNNNNDINNKYMSMISQQLSLIIKNQNEMCLIKSKHQMLKNRSITRSLNDLTTLN